MAEVAIWLQQDNLTNSTKIGVVRFRYVLTEYLNDTDLVDFPLTQGYTYAKDKQIQYIVLHRSHTTGGINPLFRKDDKHFKLEQTFKTDKGEDIVYIYKVHINYL